MRFQLFFLGLLLAIFGFACSGTKGSVKPVLTLRELYKLADTVVAESKKMVSFTAEGQFLYVDKKRRLDLAISVRHDQAAAFTRIQFLGALDNHLWGEVVVHRGRVRLHFPLQKRLYQGVYSNFDLYSFTRIHIQLFELIQLVQGRLYFINDFEKWKGSYSADYNKLVLKNKKEFQLLFFSRRSSRLAKTVVFTGKKERGRIYYQYYKLVDGVSVPAKTTLKVAAKGLRAIIWFNKMSRKYKYSSGDEKIILDKKTEIVQM